MPAGQGGSLLDAAHRAFAHGMTLSMAVCAATALLGAVIAFLLIPGAKKAQPDHRAAAEPQGESVPA